MIAFSLEVNPFIIIQIIIFVFQLHLAFYVYKKYKEVEELRKQYNHLKAVMEYYKKRFGLEDIT